MLAHSWCDNKNKFHFCVVKCRRMHAVTIFFEHTFVCAREQSHRIKGFLLALHLIFRIWNENVSLEKIWLYHLVYEQVWWPLGSYYSGNKYDDIQNVLEIECESELEIIMKYLFVSQSNRIDKMVWPWKSMFNWKSHGTIANSLPIIY